MWVYGIDTPHSPSADMEPTAEEPKSLGAEEPKTASAEEPIRDAKVSICVAPEQQAAESGRVSWH